jgi:outer membrane receptor for ferrienterochelin and colicin
MTAAAAQQPPAAQPPAQPPPPDPIRIEQEVTVSATRTERGIEDEPMRVEVLDRDEIEEKLMMTPGDIVMMLNEMGGLRVQATSPSLGAASVRIQGMRGRYTRFLTDGLPLSGEQVGSFGLLQIPPVDLGQVEVIKGVASSLYGAGAMGGVVNLVSRRPGTKPEGQLLVNRSTRGATDAAFWQAAPLTDRWSYALLVSANGQSRFDADDDHCRVTRAPSSGRACSGTTRAAARSSPRSARRSRIGSAARCRGPYSRQPDSRTSRRSIRSGSMAARRFRRWSARRW